MGSGYVYSVRVKSADSVDRITVVLTVSDRLNTEAGKQDFHIKLSEAIHSIRDSRPFMKNLFVERIHFIE